MRSVRFCVALLLIVLSMSLTAAPRRSTSNRDSVIARSTRFITRVIRVIAQPLGRLSPPVGSPETPAGGQSSDEPSEQQNP